jgi:hypothetical protein
MVRRAFVIIAAASLLPMLLAASASASASGLPSMRPGRVAIQDKMVGVGYSAPTGIHGYGPDRHRTTAASPLGYLTTEVYNTGDRRANDAAHQVCGRSCKAAARQFAKDYNAALKHVCYVNNDKKCYKHPLPREQVSADVRVCVYTTDCSASFSRHIGNLNAWYNDHDRQWEAILQKRWGCKKTCPGPNWVSVVDFYGDIAQGGCIIATDGIGTVVCQGAAVAVQTAVDALLGKGNIHHRILEAWKNTFITTAPFGVSLIKELFK